jgi:hypothetical protein
MAALWAGHLNRPVCPLWVISGQTVTSPKPEFVRYCPKADKMLRCVRLLKREGLLASRNFDFRRPPIAPRQEIGPPLQTILPLVTVEKPRGTVAALPAKVPRLNEKPRARKWRG